MPGTRARLSGLGMTKREIDLWLVLEDVGARLAALPELHPMAEHEAGHALRRVQDLLLSRRRGQGWGSAGRADPDERRERLVRFGMTEPSSSCGSRR